MWSWDCCEHGQTVGNTLSKRHSDSTKKACGKLVNVFDLSEARSWNWENLWAEARRAWQPPGMLPTSPGQDLPEASVALFDLEMDLMLTPVQVCQAFQDICQRPTALIIKTPWLTSDLTRAWIFWCCNNQNSFPAKYSGLGGLAHHRCNLLTFFDRHCY